MWQRNLVRALSILHSGCESAKRGAHFRGGVFPARETLTRTPCAGRKPRPKTRIPDDARKRRGERFRVPRRCQQPRIVSYQGRNLTCRGADNRQSVRECFGDSHSVGLLQRGRCEHVCAVVTL